MRHTLRCAVDARRARRETLVDRRGRAAARSARTRAPDGFPHPRPPGGRRPRAPARARGDQTTLAAGGPAAARERDRLDRSSAGRALGRRAAGHGRQEHPGLRLAAAQGAWCGRLVTRPPGYALRVEPSELDLARFERLRAEARRSGPRGAAAKLREALALWRGPPFADLAYEPCVQAESARLEDLRLAALEERIDADLAAGRHADIVGELETLIGRAPVRERLRGQLMLALYRSARQAEALHAYQAARRELATSSGSSRAASSSGSSSAILQQDPALDLPVQARGSPGTGERSLLVVPSAPERPGRTAGAGRAAGRRRCPARAGAGVHRAGGRRRARRRPRSPPAPGARRRGVAARTAAFSSPAPGADLARLAERQGVRPAAHGRRPRAVRRRGPRRPGSTRRATSRCWSAGLAPPRAGARPVRRGAPRLGGARARRVGGARDRRAAAADRRRVRHRPDGRDASRLLADASLIVQRRSGVVAEPLLTPPGRKGVIGLAAGAGLLVVGLPDGWREEGSAACARSSRQAPPAPTVLVRRGTGVRGAGRPRASRGR